MKTKALILGIVLLLLVTMNTSLKAQTATPPASGDGSAGNPYQIATLNNLTWVAQTNTVWDKHFIQTADIDASDTQNWVDGNGVEKGWIAIAFSGSFTGSYNGNGHTIDGLYIDRGNLWNPMGNAHAFISSLGAGGTVQNLGLTNVDISGSDGWGCLAGLVAMSRGNITNCYTTGTVSDTENNGGLVGLVEGGSISGCYSSATITTVGERSGGLVGSLNGSSATISNCYSTGSVTGEDKLGGFVGLIYSGTISDCYSTGDVTRDGGTDTSLGAFCGSMADGTTIEYSYSTGSVYYDGGSNPSDKGFVGSSSGSPTTTSNFFDSEVSNQSTAIGATAKNINQMNTQCTFTDAGWDFMGETANGSNNNWGLNPSNNSGYPFLQWQGYTHVPSTGPEMDLKQSTTPIADGGSYNFGEQAIGTNTDVIFTIENNGNVNLSLTTPLTISGANADQFSIQQQPSTPVSSSGSTTFTVRFSPTSSGAKTATISIANNDCDENPYDFTIQGTGAALVAPEMDVKKGSFLIVDNTGIYGFGNQAVGTDTDITFTIENNGDSDLILSGSPFITINGANADQYSVQQQPSSPISPSGNTTFTVRFSPTSEGTKTATVNIPNNDSDENPYDFSVLGTGQVPEMNLKQGSINIADGGSHDFGSHATGTNTDVTFTIENTGNADLTLSGSPIISIGGTDANQFSVEQQPTSPVSPSGNKTFKIRFSPTSAGAKTATIAINNNDGNENPYNLTISGTGQAPEMDLKQGTTPIADGGSYDFGSHVRNTNTDVTFTIENTGNANLTLTTITIGGTNADQFNVEQQPSSPVSGSGSTTFKVRFSPTSTGAKTATISIANNDGDENPYDLTITGTGTLPPPNGSGTSGDPYQIATLENLQWLSQAPDKWDKYYIQTSNIDASATSGWNGGAGFSPIGYGSSEFTGSYNGNGKTIDGLYINRSGESSIGLFGYTNNATIQDLGVTNANITGNQNIGGLVGYAGGSTTVTNCYSTGSVSGYKNVGGLEGDNINNASVSNCYSSCSVSGSHSVIGGLVGYNRGTISNCYASGSASGGMVGGLVGLSPTSGSVVKSYSTSSVTGTWAAGGLIGENWGQTVSNCFWDTQTSGKSTSAGGTGKTTAEMKTRATFIDAGWDFMDETANGSNDYWGLNQNENGSYPFCEWQGYANVVPPEMNLKKGSTNIADGGSYDFGSKATGSNTDVTFMIENTGNGDLTLSGSPIISISGTNANQFSVQQQPSSPVAPYGNTTFKIRFSPTSTGTKTATIAIANNDGDENPYNLTITGMGQNPEMDLKQGTTPIADAGSYDFGAHLKGTNTDITFTIENNGNVNLILSGSPIITLNGVNADQFSVLQQPTSPVTVSNFTTFQIRFTPTSAGVKTASISIANNDENENPYDLTLTGTGQDPEMDLKQGTTPIADGGSYNFGSKPKGSDTDVNFTIENSGNVNLTLSGSPIITIGGTHASQFSVQQQPTSPVTASGNTTFKIRFSPTSTGVKTASISISNNDTNENPYDLTITGTGQEPEMDLKQGTTNIADGGSHDFGDHSKGTDTDVTFTIENNGDADLILSGSPIITIGGANADQFSVQAQPTSPVSPSGNTTFEIRFSPTSKGAKTATISISNNDSNENPYDLTITGTGQEPEMDLKQGSTNIADGGSDDFGAHPKGTDTDVTFTIENNGDADLTLSGSLIITIGGANADQFSVQAQPTSPVNPSGNTTFEIRFSPTSKGVKTANISISNNDSNENPYDLTITGTGQEPEMDLKQGATPIADAGNYDFGEQTSGSDTDVTFTIENSGDANLTMDGTPIITINGTNADQFSVQAQPNSTVAPSGSTTFVIRFSPTSSGAKTATIAIANNDTDENPYNLTLTGTGQNTQPTATNTTQTQTYTEGDATVAIDDIVVTDPDPAEQITATLTLSNTTTGALTANSGKGETYTGSTGIWTVTGSVANVNTALAAVAFEPETNNDVDATVAVDIRDGLEAGTTPVTGTITLDVTAVNDAPTISEIANQTTNEDTPTDAIPFTVGDVETNTAALTVNGSSNNQTLVPNGNIVFGGSGANRTVTITPADNQSGEATITVTVSDGKKETDETFVLTVNPVNDPPTISEIADQVTDEDTPTNPLRFKIGDLETDLVDMIVTGRSNRQTLIPDENIVFNGSGANRNVTITPAADQSGQATITVTVSDGEEKTEETFVLTVNGVDDAPTISDIADQVTDEDTPTDPIPFTIGDDLTDPADLVVTAFSNNGKCVPNDNIVLDGSGENRTIQITPGVNRSAVPNPIVISVAVSDGTNETVETFKLTINPVNDAPTISDITDQVTNEDTPTDPIPFTIRDGEGELVETDPDDLKLSAGSDNLSLIPNTNIILAGSGANRTVTIAPLPEQSGSATITVTVSDGELESSDTFLLTVEGVNDPPVISDIVDQTTTEDTPTSAIPFIIGDAETKAGELTLTATSDNETLVPQANIVFGGNDENRTVTITPAAQQSGSTTIIVTVSDGNSAASDTFTVTVNAVNDPPTISDIADKTIAEDTPLTAVSFTVGDSETKPDDLTLSVVSSNQSLIPDSSFNFGGKGADRTLSAEPLPNQFGSTVVTVTVSDGTDAVSDTFTVTVNPVNDPPTISDIADQITNEDTPTEPIEFTIGDVETDPDELTLSASSDNLALVTNENIVSAGSGTDRTVTITPLPDQHGTTTITVTVSDGEDAVSDTFTITVNDVNDPPVVAGIQGITFDEDDSTSFDLDLYVTDADNDTSEINWTGKIFGDFPTAPNDHINTPKSTKPLNECIFVSIDSVTHVVTLKAIADFNYAEAKLEFVAADPDEQTCRDTTSVCIHAVNDAPFFVAPIPAIEIVQGSSYTVPWSLLYLLVEDVDNLDSTLTWSAEKHPYLSFSITDDSATFSASIEWYGTDTLTVTVSDGELTDQTLLFITVLKMKDITAPATPVNFTAAANPGCIELSWDANSEEDVYAYILYRSTDSTTVDTTSLLTTVLHPETTFSDSSVEIGVEYFYCLAVFDTAGNVSEMSKLTSVKITTNIDEFSSLVPDNFKLSQNYPNPFNPSTTIKYALPEKAHVKIVIYNIMGQEVAKLIDEEMEPGYHLILWDAKGVQSGIYIYRIQAGEFMNVKKCLMIK